MVEQFSVGMKLSAKYTDGEFYPATVRAISEIARRKKAPISVTFDGHGDDATWLGLDSLRTKKQPKATAAAAKEVPKFVAKVAMDYSALTPGSRLQAESGGVWYVAEVVSVSTAKAKAKTPVKVRFAGYTAESDEWLGAERLRSKALKAKAPGDAPGKAPRRTHSLADQVARFERAKKENNERFLNIDSVYNGAFLKGKRVLVVGASRGLGFKLLQQIAADGGEVVATCRRTTDELNTAGAAQIIEKVDVQDMASCTAMAEQVQGSLDFVIHNAGYFTEEHESLKKVLDKEAIKQIDICGVGPLRVVSALHNAGKLVGAKVVVITSQAGSCHWRTVQNKDKGGDYGHHMSRAACNIAAVLMSEELKPDGIPVKMLHPGFNRTEMTAKYKEIWDKEGAVDPAQGARRVLYEMSKVTMATTGHFVNCEDGLQIPW